MVAAAINESSNKDKSVSQNVSMASSFFIVVTTDRDARLSSPLLLFHSLSFSHSRDSYFLLSGAVACERCVLTGRKSRMFTFGCVGAFCFHCGLPCGSFLKNMHTCTHIHSFFLLTLSFSLWICMQMPWKRATASLAFFLTHTVFLSLSRTSWGLEVKSLCGRPVCICDLTVYRLLPRKDATRRHTWADLKQNLQWIES